MIKVSREIERGILLEMLAKRVKVGQAAADVFDRAKFVRTGEDISVQWRGRCVADESMRSETYSRWMNRLWDDYEAVRERAQKEYRALMVERPRS